MVCQGICGIECASKSLFHWKLNCVVFFLSFSFLSFICRPWLCRLQQRLEPLDMQFWIYIYDMNECQQSTLSIRLLEVVVGTIVVKQGCPLSPTLLGLYVNKISNYIEGLGGSGTCLARVAILMFATDVLISNILSPKESWTKLWLDTLITPTLLYGT
mgnify:CR=1 FL=1